MSTTVVQSGKKRAVAYPGQTRGAFSNAYGFEALAAGAAKHTEKADMFRFARDKFPQHKDQAWRNLYKTIMEDVVKKARFEKLIRRFKDNPNRPLSDVVIQGTPVLPKGADDDSDEEVDTTVASTPNARAPVKRKRPEQDNYEDDDSGSDAGAISVQKRSSKKSR